MSSKHRIPRDNSIQSNPHIILATSNSKDGNMSLRWGDADEVIQHRRDFLLQHDIHLEDCIVMDVEHKEKILIVDSSHRSTSTDAGVVAEALITKEKGLTLFLLAADCLPIALYDPTNEVIALAHLGWKPTGRRLIQKVVQKLYDSFNSDPHDIMAYIGPGIKKESYIFPSGEVKQKLTDSSVSGGDSLWAPFLIEIGDGEVGIDVVGYNEAQMLDAGMLARNISIDPTDTITSKEYYSHYRSVRAREKEKRFATILTLK